ncbi:hypothetical protein Pen02_58660 [Plantactinospora endophytica]|uniref:Uncharacterized protein n=1 Tax=Plantactinospora endophytica TaxID=673535 RepID=A0ABQ4E885_9ACTN|nr:hypothetical protein Pen02_58660 [Plantactinospora endophytica]
MPGCASFRRRRLGPAGLGARWHRLGGVVFDVRVRLGETVRIEAADRFRPTDGPVVLWVTGVRLVANRPEQYEWVWLEGVKIMHDGRSGDQAQILVRACLLAPVASESPGWRP